MLQLHNNTPFAASMALFPNEEAIDTLYVMVKATFNIGKQWTLADEQAQPVEADEYWTEPEKSSIKYASDYHTGKACSDVIMIGHACSPQNKEVTELDVSLSVDEKSKSIKIFGDREWQGGRITRPKPFTTMAMIYEKAYGGIYMHDGEILSVEARNPIGHGFAGERKDKGMNGVPLPNLEDPDNLIANINDQPEPACFGSRPGHWMPRSQYAGTYDEEWLTKRAPYLPKDFDKRFFSMAHPDLVFPGFLQGGEPVEIKGMHPGGTMKFTIPHVKLTTDVIVSGNSIKPQHNLETLIIEPNELKLSMTWRAAVQCDKKALKISEINISLAK